MRVCVRVCVFVHVRVCVRVCLCVRECAQHNTAQHSTAQQSTRMQDDAAQYTAQMNELMDGRRHSQMLLLPNARLAIGFVEPSWS